MLGPRFLVKKVPMSRSPKLTIDQSNLPEAYNTLSSKGNISGRPNTDQKDKKQKLKGRSPETRMSRTQSAVCRLCCSNRLSESPRKWITVTLVLRICLGLQPSAWDRNLVRGKHGYQAWQLLCQRLWVRYTHAPRAQRVICTSLTPDLPFGSLLV